MVNSSRRLLLVLCFAFLAATSATAQTSPIFFQPQSVTLPYVSGQTYASNVYLFGDMNGDGKADIVFMPTQGSVEVQLNDGTQKEAATLACSASAGNHAAGPQLVDVNGDGKLDFVTPCNSTAGLSVALGNGNGTFGTPFVVATPGTFSLFTLADMNGDGTLDLIANMTSGANTGQMMVGLIKGTTLTAAHYYAVSGTVSNIVTGDFNDDGKMDLATSGSGLTYWLGHGDGTLAASSYLFNEGNQYCLAAADMNGDGITDLVTCSQYTATIDELFGNKAGELTVNSSYPAAFNAYGPLNVADLTGKGVNDLISSGDTVTVLLNDGAGNLSVANSYDDYVYYPVQIADWNGDGHPDVLQFVDGGYNTIQRAATPPTLYVMPGGADGAFTGPPTM